MRERAETEANETRESRQWECEAQKKECRPAGDEELARAFVPHLRYDRAEPFALQGIGYTLFRDSRGEAGGASGKSPSCSRVLEAPTGGCVIEYAFYYDFDIQHLYDLEHTFVYLDKDGEIAGVESSFHGKFLNSRIEGVTEFEGSHPVLYVQPGKHALLPAPEYFRLVIDRDTACGQNAGRDGFLISDMFRGRLFTDAGFDRRVEEYIRGRYAFAPTWEFTAKSPDGRSAEELLMPYGELDGLIVERLGDWSRRIAMEGSVGRKITFGN